MKIKLTSIYVDDQEKALGFYTNVLGLTKKADFSNAGFRWLTVASPEDPNGTELQLASTDNPAGKAFQQAFHVRIGALEAFQAESTGDLGIFAGELAAHFANVLQLPVVVAQQSGVHG